jgi:hypothetical protein
MAAGLPAIDRGYIVGIGEVRYDQAKHINLGAFMKITALLAAAGFAALAISASVTTITPAQAQRWEDCRERIHDAQRHLDHMTDRFGFRSPQARDARHDLERTRDWCYNNHRRDWDRGWHGDRDRHDSWGH